VSLSDGGKSVVKSEMLNCIKEEPQRTITKKVCDTVSELGAVLLEDAAGWPELLPFMFQCVQSGQKRLMESALLIFEALARYVVDVMLQYLGTLHGLLIGCLAHASIDVRLAAFKATVAFIQSLENSADRDKFQAAVPLLLQVVAGALNAGDEVAAQDAIEAFIEVAEDNPRFLRRQLAEVTGAMLQIAETTALEEGTRRLAAEVLMSLCEAREKAPGMMRKLPAFTERLFACAVSFLLDVEDAPEWHTAEDEKDEDEGKGELFDFGQECLDRMAFSLGGKALVPVAGVALPTLLADADWRKRHAALICLAQIAEGCVKVMQDQKEALINLCLSGAADPHARVRWGACQAIGQLCTDLGPDLQDEAHAQIMPALLGLMDDFANPRVQAHSCAATVNFAEGADQDVVGPYLDALISKLLALLQRGRRNVQEGALTALASVADCSQDYFVKYYDSCMPLLRHVLEHATVSAGGAAILKRLSLCDVM
jgi:importin-5